MERKNSIYPDTRFYIQKLKSLEYLLDDFNDIKQLDEEYQQRDAALTLLAGELRALTQDLLAALKVKETVPTLEEVESQ